MHIKILLISLLLMVASFASHAQQPSVAVPVRTKEYCQLMTYQRLNGKFKASIDYGQQQSLLGFDAFWDAQGELVEFNSAVAALNWLNVQGWELVNAYSVGGNNSTTFYKMRRRIQSRAFVDS